jgi:endonuclease/exonuclease/phosphatase family metal-dependent hydrolase
MKTVLLLLFIGICFPALSFGDLTVRVLTYNIHHGEGVDGKLDLDRIASVIRSVNADVVCLQEVDRNLPRTNHLDFPAILAKALDMRVVFEPNFQFDGGDYGNATLTRLEIESNENFALPGPEGREPRGCLRVTVWVEGQQVDVFNTHLGLEPDERKMQASEIVKHLADRPTVLAGDLNETYGQPALRILTGRLRDSAGNDAIPTIPAQAPAKRIDFVLVSEEFTVSSSSVMVTPETQAASDHLPIAASLALSSVAKTSEKIGPNQTGAQRTERAIEEGRWPWRRKN